MLRVQSLQTRQIQQRAEMWLKAPEDVKKDENVGEKLEYKIRN